MDIRKILGKVVEVNDLEDLFKYVNKLIIPDIVIFENEEYQANFIDTSYYVEVLLKRTKDLRFRKVRVIEMYKDENGMIIKAGYHYHYNGNSKFVLDRENGPALVRRSIGNIRTLQETFWYTDGKLHRTDGPAYMLYDNNYEIVDIKWYINDRELDEFEIEVMKAIEEVKLS